MRPSASGARVLLRLERRLQPVRPVAVGHDAAGELVDHADAAVAHQVVDIAPQQDARVQGAVDRRQQRIVLGIVQVGDAEGPFHAGEPRLGQLDAPAVLVRVEVDAPSERRHLRREAAGRGDARLGASGEDQRRARLVDQQRVGLVDQRHVERPVDDGVRIARPQVAEVVETRFLGGDIRHVGPIRPAAIRRRHALLDGSDRQAQHPVDRSHPVGVTPGEVVVERQDVHAVAAQRVQGGRHHGNQRLALAGLHLDDAAAREGQRGHDLHVERPQAEGAAGHFAREREELRLELVERRAGSGVRPKLARPQRERRVGQARDLRLQPGDGVRATRRARADRDRLASLRGARGAGATRCGCGREGGCEPLGPWRSPDRTNHDGVVFAAARPRLTSLPTRSRSNVQSRCTCRRVFRGRRSPHVADGSCPATPSPPG